MGGIDHWLVAHFSGVASVPVILVAAVLLGFRHATDPDHLAAIMNLIAAGGERGRRQAVRLGLSWGAGHGLILLAVGLPIVIGRVYLPIVVQHAADAGIGLLIAVLAVRLLVLWRRGRLAHETHPKPTRSPLQAFAIGLLHGLGGSAAVTVMVLTLVSDPLVAATGLGIFAVCAALSMAALSTGFAAALQSAVARRPFALLAPALGTATLGFGVFLIGISASALGGV